MSSSFANRRWWTIMPIVFITYSLAYLDRANFGFASAAGINEDLGISKGLSSLIGALFFLGYFFFQIPGAIYAERRSVKRLVFVSLVLWGACASLTGIVSNVPSLMAIRFVLGVVEAAVMPAMLIFISNWFTKRERSRANTFLSRQPGDGAVDVDRVRLSGARVRLAPDVHCGRRAGDRVGGDLVVRRAGQARSGRLAVAA
jgi:sugar phosphate permease